MEEHKTKIDAEKECEEVRRIFTNVNEKQMRESLRELEKDECKQIREGKSRTIYEVGDIADKVKERVTQINEELEDIDYFAAKRRFAEGKERRMYEVTIEELAKHEDFKFDETREAKKDWEGLSARVEELVKQFGDVVVRDRDEKIVMEEPYCDKALTVKDGLYRLLECEIERTLPRIGSATVPSLDMKVQHGDVKKYSVKDIIEIGRRKIEQIDSEINEEKKEEDMRRNELQKQKKLYGSIVEALCGLKEDEVRELFRNIPENIKSVVVGYKDEKSVTVGDELNTLEQEEHIRRMGGNEGCGIYSLWGIAVKAERKARKADNENEKKKWETIKALLFKHYFEVSIS